MNIAQLDHRITARLHKPKLKHLWSTVSRFGDGPIYLLTFMVVRNNGNKAGAARIAIACFVAWSLCAVLKGLCKRERPRACVTCKENEARGITVWHRYKRAIRFRSFPSQHSAVAVAFAVALWPNPLPVVLAGAICASRVLIGAHYVGDVLAGIAVGLIAGRLA